jgi:hypothetical protein
LKNNKATRRLMSLRNGAWKMEVAAADGISDAAALEAWKSGTGK